MVNISRKDIDQLDKLYRANLINSITGYKPANLIGTISKEGQTNLTIISSVIHMGSNPPLVGFIQRPVSVRRDTYNNIRELGYYTLNHIHGEFIEKAHQTSAKYDADVSEFDACGFGTEYLKDFPAPFVQESKVKVGLKFVEEVPIRHNNTLLIIGEVIDIHLSSQSLEPDGRLDLNVVNDVCISGLDTYNKVSHKVSLQYARPDQPVEIIF